MENHFEDIRVQEEFFMRTKDMETTIVWNKIDGIEIDTSISVPYAWTTITAPPVEEFE